MKLITYINICCGKAPNEDHSKTLAYILEQSKLYKKQLNNKNINSKIHYCLKVLGK